MYYNKLIKILNLSELKLPLVVNFLSLRVPECKLTQLFEPKSGRSSTPIITAINHLGISQSDEVNTMNTHFIMFSSATLPFDKAWK